MTPPSRNEMLHESPTRTADGSRIIANETMMPIPEANLKLGRRASWSIVRCRQEDRPLDLEDIARWFESRSWPPIPSSIREDSSSPSGIENGESRAEAMLLLAEAQSRNNQNDAATASYQGGQGRRDRPARRPARGPGGLVVDSLIAERPI